MDHKVVLLYRNESVSQGGVHEGEVRVFLGPLRLTLIDFARIEQYSPYVLAHMIELVVHEIQKILDPPRGPPHWSMIQDRYRCRVGNLRYLGFEAPYPSTSPLFPMYALCSSPTLHDRCARQESAQRRIGCYRHSRLLPYSFAIMDRVLFRHCSSSSSRSNGS